MADPYRDITVTITGPTPRWRLVLTRLRLAFSDGLNRVERAQPLPAIPPQVIATGMAITLGVGFIVDAERDRIEHEERLRDMVEQLERLQVQAEQNATDARAIGQRAREIEREHQRLKAERREYPTMHSDCRRVGGWWECSP